MRDSSSNSRDREQSEESCPIITSTCNTAPGAPSRRPWSHSTSSLGLLTLHGTKLQLSPWRWQEGPVTSYPRTVGYTHTPLQDSALGWSHVGTCRPSEA